MLVTSIAAKAWEVGDYYNLDGVPSIVVWVDSTGEHGLRMTPNANSIMTEPNKNKFYKKDAKNQKKQKSKERWDKCHEKYEEIVAWQNEHILNMNSKKTEVPISVEKLFQSNCEYGEINMASVLAFCEENNIDMETYFPSYYWASNIGNSWFIPGAYEAELISKIYFDGLASTRDYIKYGYFIQDFAKKTGEEYFNSIHVFNMDQLLTSTLILGDWTKNKENEAVLGLIEVPESEKKGGWYDYNELYRKRAYEYRGVESTISLILTRLYYIPPFSKATTYYLLMKNQSIGYVSAVSYF